ncbi:hypothetical protein [Luteitalea pratensis]|nr:hypothetical protein [Luteitalea pratensis]
MADRRYVGAVAGSIGNATSTRLGHFDLSNLHRHAVGRSVAMVETVVHAAFMKAAGFITPGTPVEFTGAQYQDFKGTREFVRAHRATLALKIGARNIADLAGTRRHADLWRVLVGPQAVTDLLPLYANYADRFLEIIVAPKTFRLLRTVIERQEPHQDVNVSNVAEAMDALMKVHDEGYSLAAARIRELRKERGWVEVPLSAAARSLTKPAPFNPEAANNDKALRLWLHGAPGSPLVHERLELMSPLRPTELGEAPEVFLVASQESSRSAMPTLMCRSHIDATCSTLDNAASMGDKEGRGAAQR